MNQAVAIENKYQDGLISKAERDDLLFLLAADTLDLAQFNAIENKYQDGLISKAERDDHLFLLLSDK